MLVRLLTVAALCLAMAGCGLKSPQKASRTLAGINQQQILIAAQHAMAEDGIDVEQMDFANGVLLSTWQGKSKRRIQYEVAVTPKGVAPGKSETAPAPQSGVETMVIIVSANAKEKLVGGWSEPAKTNLASTEELLDDIISLAITRYDPNTVATTQGSFSTLGNCSSSSDCPGGMHCASAKCVVECAQDADCGTGKRCDENGRCVLPLPEPCPEAAPAFPEPPAPPARKRRRSRNDN